MITKGNIINRITATITIFVLISFMFSVVVTTVSAHQLENYRWNNSLTSNDRIMTQQNNTPDYGVGTIQLASFSPPDLQAMDEFGWSVAVSRDTAVIGARNHDPVLGNGILTGGGAAYVFVRSGNSWIQQAKLTPKQLESGDSFGVSVAIDGNTVVIGAPGSDVEDKNDAGAAYVFIREGVEWKQKQRLVASDFSTGDGFGVSVSIENDLIVVGADSKDLSLLFDAGAAYIFSEKTGTWLQTAKLISQNAGFGEYFGTSVAIDGGIVVIGATEANPFGSRGAGTAYIFRRSNQNWIQEKQLEPKISRNGDFFGASVAISNETVAIGAPFADPDTGAGRVGGAGSVFVFRFRSGEWKEDATLSANDASSLDQFGQSVAISGNRILVGATGKTREGYSRAGAAYLYSRQGSEWEQQTKIVAEYAYKDDRFGWAVSMSGDTILIGAVGRDPNLIAQAGEALLFRTVQTALPATGFTPGHVTKLEPQLESKEYSELGDLWLELPGLGQQMPIVAVPKGNDGWDVTWLWGQAGYLSGTAFPTWQGNTGIAAHVNLPNGLPGPFAEIDTLKWGDLIFIHAWGAKYVYEIRQVMRVDPWDLSILAHEELDWVTLITCSEFNPGDETYSLRSIVRGVLTKVEPEK